MIPVTQLRYQSSQDVVWQLTLTLLNYVHQCLTFDPVCFYMRPSRFHSLTKYKLSLRDKAEILACEKPTGIHAAMLCWFGPHVCFHMFAATRWLINCPFIPWNAETFFFPTARRTAGKGKVQFLTLKLFLSASDTALNVPKTIIRWPLLSCLGFFHTVFFFLIRRLL